MCPQPVAATPHGAAGAESMSTHVVSAAHEEHMIRPYSFRIRTITVFLPRLVLGDKVQWREAVNEASHLLRVAREAYQRAGYEVQTTRIATPSYRFWTPPGPDALLDIIDFERLVLDAGVSFVSVGHAPVTPQLRHEVPAMLSATSIVSCSAFLGPEADRTTATWAAEVVLDVSDATAGAGNFRFCVGANCGPGVPYFPMAYAGLRCHSQRLQFAIGTENSALLHKAFKAAEDSIEQAPTRLRSDLEGALLPVDRIAEQVAASSGSEYLGIDASICPGLDTPPMPDAFELLGIGRFGGAGTTAVAALVTGVLKALPLRLCGYTGLMLPVCEDAGLAARAQHADFRVSDLLHYSAVCGCGLDTVPVQGRLGNAEEDAAQTRAIAATLLDMHAIAFRLNKPLSCRLLPVPRKIAGDMTTFDNPHLLNTRILRL